MQRIINDLRGAYEDREVKQAVREISEATTRRLGPDAKEEAADLLDRLSGPEAVDYVRGRVGWLTDGSYGFGAGLLIQREIEQLPETEGRRKQALKRIAINAFMNFVLRDTSDLNARKVTEVVRKSGNMDAFNAAIIEDLIEDYQL